MVFIREEKLIKPVEEKIISWESKNGKWQIIGTVQPHPENESRRWVVIVINRYNDKLRKMDRYHIGVKHNRNIMPAYVTDMYNQINNELRGSKNDQT